MAECLEFDQEHKLMVEHISEAIRKSLDLKEILNTTVRELGQALSASRCCLAVIDARSPTDLSDDELVFDYCWQDPARGGTPLANRVVLITDDSILRMILAQGSLLSMDVLDDSTFRPLFEDGGPEDWRSIKSLIACPISTRERPIGLILLHQCDTLRTWTDSELELVHSVATHVALAMEHARLYAHSKALAEQELLINHIVRAVRSSLDLDTILSTVTKELREALAVDRCQIGQPRTDAPLVVSHEFTAPGLVPAVGLSIYGQEPPVQSCADTATVLGIDLNRIKADVGTTGDTTDREVPLAVISDVSEDKRAAPFKQFLEHIASRSLISAPLLDGTRLLGVLMVHQSSEHRQWQPEEVSLVAAIADQVSVAISHARLFSQVKFQAITDGLTGLYNHVYLKKRLSDEMRRAQRKGSPLSLLMLDLDKLKEINDSYGHPVGDAAIRQVAWSLKNLLRSGDTAARYGGEEFAVILPETPLAEASRIAERLCRQINANPVAGLGLISVSIGAASYPAEAANLEDLVNLADQALYQAKTGGRNQVRTWQVKAGV
jgi:diguanylate cyclase (GGDEF)-like protein